MHHTPVPSSCVRAGWRGLRLFFSGCGLALAVGLLPAVTSESALPRFPLYERYVAIDGSCGWPLLILLPNGSIACYIWPDSSHGYSEGAVECWLSHDQGLTWRRGGVPVPNEPTTNRMNHAGGVAADGSLVALVSGWENRKPKGWMPPADDKSRPLKHFAGSRTRKPVPAISRDNGLTWTQYPEITDPEDTDRRPAAYGRVGQLPNGELGVMLYSAVVDFYTSADGGATWKKRGRVSNTGRGETTWIRLANGDLFAASRTTEAKDNYMLLQGLRSKDNGATWTFEHDLTLTRQHPADLTALPDGRILLTYGIRNEGNWSIAYRVADAEAKNWSAPVNWSTSRARPTSASIPSPCGMAVILPPWCWPTAPWSPPTTPAASCRITAIMWGSSAGKCRRREPVLLIPSIAPADIAGNQTKPSLPHAYRP